MEESLEETIEFLRTIRRRGYIPEKEIFRNPRDKALQKVLNANTSYKTKKVRGVLHKEKIHDFILRINYMVENLNDENSVLLIGRDVYFKGSLLSGEFSKRISFPLPLFNKQELKYMENDQIQNFLQNQDLYKNIILNQRSNFYKFLNIKEMLPDQQGLTLDVNGKKIISNSDIYFLNGDTYLTFPVPLKNDKFFRVFEPVNAEKVEVYDKITGEEAFGVKVKNYEFKKQALLEKTEKLVNEIGSFIDVNYS